MTALRTPPLTEVIRLALEAKLIDLHVALPGKVEAYDPVKQVADVVPLLMGVQIGPDGSSTAIALQKLPNVPVLFPGGGGLRATFPVAAGDTVLLIIADRSLDTWKAKGGVVDPKVGQHSLPDAIAIPGLKPPSSPWTGADPAAITIGSDGGAFQGVGLGHAIRTELDALWAAIFGGHTHPGVTAGAASTGPAVGSSSTQVVESASLKVTP